MLELENMYLEGHIFVQSQSCASQAAQPNGNTHQHKSRRFQVECSTYPAAFELSSDPYAGQPCVGEPSILSVNPIQWLMRQEWKICTSLKRPANIRRSGQRQDAKNGRQIGSFFILSAQVSMQTPDCGIIRNSVL